MTIYEITNEFAELQDRLEAMSKDEDGEWREDDISDVYQAYMDSSIALEEKIDNTVNYIKDLRGDVKAIDEEILNLRNRVTAKQNKIALLEDCLEYAFDTLGIDKWENSRHRLFYRSGTRVDIPDELSFMANEENKAYLKPQPPKIDRIAIRDALKRGEEVEGATLKKTANFQIK